MPRVGDFNISVIPPAVRESFTAALRSFAVNVRSVGDVFDLLREDTPELPRYLLTLNAAVEHASCRDSSGERALRACDLGGYFGIIAAALTKLGYETHLVDSYGPLLTSDDHGDLRAWWKAHKLRVHDIDLQTPALTLPFADGSLDLVALEAVIEHFPHTPRLVLEEIRRVLRPDGLLLLDTPNAGAFGTRVGFFLHGGGIWTSASDLYFSEVPFRGHSRCYSRSELGDVLHWAGFNLIDMRLFDLKNPERPTSVSGRMLYERLYPLLRGRYPGLRNCIWLAATPAGN